jgi:phosphonate transport system substrate-binding protein
MSEVGDMGIKIKILFVTLLMITLAILEFRVTSFAESGKQTSIELETINEYIIKIAIQPTTKPAVSLERYQPLIDYLKESTKLNIELIITENYDDFSLLQKEEKVDFVIQDALSSYFISQHIELIPIASVISPEGKPYDYGCVIVRADSNIKNLDDLKGKTFLFGPKYNAAKFLAIYILLKEKGFDVEKDLIYEFGGMCPNIAMSVFLGEYDAGVICALYIAQEKKKFNFKDDLKIIANTGDLVPYWIVAAVGKTDNAVLKRVKKALLELDINNPTTAEVLSVCKWKGFAEYSDGIKKISEAVKKYELPQ